MKALILTCNTGEGHNSTAAAIEEAFHSRGFECDRADALSFLSEKASQFISAWHVRIYRYIPRAFDVGYRYAEDHPALFKEDSGLYKLLTMGKTRLYDYLVQGGYDAVISVHVFSALLVTEMRKEHPGQFFAVFVGTDYTCSPITGESRMDLYFTPARELTNEFVQSGIPEEKIVSSGIPVRSHFLTHIDKRLAKETLGLGAEKRHLLMMCGSMGCGPMEELAEKLETLLGNDTILTIVCGTNEKLAGRLSKQLEGREGIRILGFTDQVPLLMDSADLYLTKPGGLSITEAAMKRLPMAFIDAVAGCEEYNLDFFVRHKMAVTASSVEELAALCAELVGNEEELAAMAGRMDECFGTKDPAQTICDRMYENVCAKV